VIDLPAMTFDNEIEGLAAPIEERGDERWSSASCRSATDRGSASVCRRLMLESQEDVHPAAAAAPAHCPAITFALNS
jgi:hypothetical protein